MKNEKLKMQKAVWLKIRVKSSRTESGPLCLLLIEN
jgi:hypothetical protein